MGHPGRRGEDRPPSCLECSDAKKKCERAEEAPLNGSGHIPPGWPHPLGRCLRCEEFSLPCTPQDFAVSRRKRERLRMLGAGLLPEDPTPLPPRRRAFLAGTTSGGREVRALRDSPTVSAGVLKPAGKPAATRAESVKPFSPDASFSSHPGYLPFNTPQATHSSTLDSPSPSGGFPIASGAETVPSDLVLLALDSFWSGYNRKMSFVHRTAFERAFASPGGPFYGASKPMALMYAMAALGLQDPEPDVALPEMDRLRYARLFCEKASELLLAGFFARGGHLGNAAPVSDLEALQTLTLLWNLALPAGLGSKVLPFMKLSVDLLVRLAVLPDGSIMWSQPQKRWDEWLRGEMIVRSWITLTNLDSSAAYMLRKEPLCDFSSAQLMLPCHEAYFLHPDPEYGFHLLAAARANGTSLPAYVDFRPFFSNPSAEEGVLLVRSLLEPFFGIRASQLVFVVVIALLRRMRFQLRAFAASLGIDPLDCFAKPAEARSPPEGAFVSLVEVFTAVADAVFSSLPAGIAEPLADGNPDPLLEGWATSFADPAHAALAAVLCTCIRGLQMEHYFLDADAVPSSAPGTVFASRAFVHVLENAILISRMFEGIRAWDPWCKLTHFTLVTPCLRMGSLGVAVIGLLRRAGQPATGLEGDVAVAARTLDWLALRHGPFSGFRSRLRAELADLLVRMAVRKVAQNFRRTILEAGIDAPEDFPLGDAAPELETDVGKLDPRLLAVGDPGRSVARMILVMDGEIKEYLET
ncbi:hypothetical protein DFJ74DRAFT_133083 [Hyaloraphidium curvatum]|nr:hypothetical protein DFJ74DRAFT_133083 [Hyaloraphidium curvatum]